MEREDVSKLISRWGLSADDDRPSVIARVLENQDNWFNKIQSELEDWDEKEAQLRSQFGDDWRPQFLDGLKSAWLNSPLFDLISVQAMDGPTGHQHYFQRPQVSAASAGGIPYSVNIQKVNITALTRKMRAFVATPPVLDRMTEIRVFDFVFEEALTPRCHVRASAI